jgi:hypothetical protein
LFEVGRLYYPGVPTYEALTGLNRLPDPATLLFNMRSGAPTQGVARRRDAVEHWSFLAGRVGYTVMPLGTRSGHGMATWCGDVDVDGLVYQVHRGPRRRILREWVDGAAVRQGKFGLDDGVWAVPAPPEPESKSAGCLGCAGGSPDTVRLAGSGPVDGIFSVWLAEHSDGTGRGIVMLDGLDDEPATVCFEPAHGVVAAGLRGLGTVRRRVWGCISPMTWSARWKSLPSMAGCGFDF